MRPNPKRNPIQRLSVDVVAPWFLCTCTLLGGFTSACWRSVSTVHTTMCDSRFWYLSTLGRIFEKMEGGKSQYSSDERQNKKRHETLHHTLVSSNICFPRHSIEAHARVKVPCWATAQQALNTTLTYYWLIKLLLPNTHSSLCYRCFLQAHIHPYKHEPERRTNAPNSETNWAN